MATGTYTQTNNPVPTYGEQSSSVGALQTSLNKKYAGVAGYTPLVVDNRYGPLTLAATKFQPNQLVVSSSPANQEFTQNSSDLTSMLGALGQANNPNTLASGGTETPTLDNTNDAYTQMLDRVSKSSSESTKALIGTIQAARSNRANTINSEYNNYKSGLQLLGIQHNAAQATPDLLMGHIKQAENEQQAKLQELDVETNKALVDAEDARNKNDLNTLKEKMAYIKDLKQEKQDYLKNIAANLGYEKSIAENQVGQYYDKMESLNPKDREAFLVAVSKKFNIPLGALVRAMADEKTAREKDALDIEDKKSIIAERKKTTSEKSGGYTPQELRKLRAEGIDPSNIEEADAFLYKGESPGDEVVYTADTIKKDSGFSTGQLWKIAMASGIKRNKNLTRQDEIDSFLTPENVDKLGEMLDAGYSPAEIADFFKNLSEE